MVFWAGFSLTSSEGLSVSVHQWQDGGVGWGDFSSPLSRSEGVCGCLFP